MRFLLRSLLYALLACFCAWCDYQDELLPWQ